MSARWETFTDIQTESVVAGFPVSSHQLQRWRGAGLLPRVRQAGKGRLTGGSETRHPIGTAAQAIEIARLLSEKEKLAGLGWKLWMRGFPVREDHWRMPLEKAHQSISHWREIVRVAVARDERRTSQRTIYDLADLKMLEGTPLYAPMMRLPAALRSTVLRVAADVLLGRFQTDGASGKPFDPEEIPTINAVLGLAADQPRVMGHTLDFAEVPQTLEKLSKAINVLMRRNYTVEEPPFRTRRDFLNAQITLIDIYTSTAWLFKGGFSLRTTERIFAKASLPTQALTLLVWNRLSATEPDMRSSTDIADMAGLATGLRDLANQIQQKTAGAPIGHPLTTKPKLRRAVSDADLLEKFVKSSEKFNELTIKSKDK